MIFEIGIPLSLLSQWFPKLRIDSFFGFQKFGKLEVTSGEETDVLKVVGGQPGNKIILLTL